VGNVEAESTNPFVRRQHSGQSAVEPTGNVEGPEANPWDWSDEKEVVVSAPTTTTTAIGEIYLKLDVLSHYMLIVADSSSSVTHQFPNLNVSDSNTNPWEVLNASKTSLQVQSAPPLERKDSGNEAWLSVPPARTPLTASLEEPPTLINVEDARDSPSWDDDEPEVCTTAVGEKPKVEEEENAWQDVAGEAGREGIASASVIAPRDDLPRDDGGWETLDPTPQESGVIDVSGEEHRSRAVPPRPPNLPPRRSTEDERPAMPPRPVEAANRATPSQGRAGQEKETYEIKKISWYDARSRSNPRISPILTQNANGPCPLLALVNALTLSTPPELNTVLIDTLRSRERVSLELLLNAVFDELMSGRRGDGTQELPDITDLYAFLVTLHTGMNVNPRFFPSAPMNFTHDPRRSTSEREEANPGTFEETREMKLYGTFSIPLIHGWLPPKSSPAYAALARSAPTYEDAQNLMFREEELEQKLQNEGLGFEDQATLEDISTIKAFFVSSATQLTEFGLETIQKSLAPGSVAILFRNDHFSTLYKHPQSGQVLHLVTDMGYAGHEEVVWESLADVTGENCEFFSGDFRPVGGAPHLASPTENSEWTTVQGRRGARDRASPRQSLGVQAQRVDATPSQPPQLPNTEQEDHDLALALQLQEEEEERHRVETERRRRESEMSERFIEQSSGSQRHTIPVICPGAVNQRRSSIPTFSPGACGGGGGRGRGQGSTLNAMPSATQENRPSIPPRRGNTGTSTAPVNRAVFEAGIDAPPPSYEVAATEPSYEPPFNHPSHPSADPGVAAQRAEMAQAQPTGRRTSSVATRPVQGRAATSSMAAMGSRASDMLAEVQSQSGSGRRRSETAEAAQQRRRQGRQQAQQQQVEGGKDKDCVVM